jgi:hypothetical protein
MTDSKTLPDTVHAWAESVLGPLTVVRDASHPRPGSRVWEVAHQGDGARHFVKINAHTFTELLLCVRVIRSEGLRRRRIPLYRSVRLSPSRTSTWW